VKTLFLEPFYGGSHRDFADGLTRASAHEITLRTLPARFWKWRMRGAALYWADQVRRPERFDALLSSSLLSLADLKSLWGPRCPPALIYFHENQFDYPLAPGESIDYQYAFTNITTALSAERILFNSHDHYRRFFQKLPELIQMMPDCRPGWIPEAIAAKSAVHYPGCHFTGNLSPPYNETDKAEPPLIIWNHRWEFDKAPDTFFQALDAVANRGIEFRLALLGERFRRSPPIFSRARRQFDKQLVQCGYVASRADYYRWLQQGAVVVSTALQENFGIAVVEAIRFGCTPLLPDRLSYPEIIPEDLHAEVFYQSPSELVEKLSRRLCGHRRHAQLRARLSGAMARFAWERRIGDFDREVSKVGAGHR
jgi:glycosyltransferase involved in cell wall biosynthesis